MPILHDNPPTLPASPEKTFPIWWITNFEVSCPSPTTGQIRYIRHAASEQGEIHPDSGERLETSEFWRMLSEVPEANAAFQAVIDASPKIWEWIKTQNPET